MSLKNIFKKAVATVALSAAVVGGGAAALAATGGSSTPAQDNVITSVVGPTTSPSPDAPATDAPAPDAGSGMTQTITVVVPDIPGLTEIKNQGDILLTSRGLTDVTITRYLPDSISGEFNAAKDGKAYTATISCTRNNPASQTPVMDDRAITCSVASLDGPA